MNTIGVTSIEPWFVLDDDLLIMDLLYFDKLVYTIEKRELLEKFCRALPNGAEKFKTKMFEIECLEKAGLVREYTNENFQKDILKYPNDQSLKYLFKSGELAQQFSTSNEFNEIFVDFLERFREVGQLNARNYSVLLNKKEADSYTPIIRSKTNHFVEEDVTNVSVVLSIVLKKFPQLSAENNLEAFIDFKQDPEGQIKLARLKDWILETSKKEYSDKEIEQKLDYLLIEYSKHLEIHQLKYNLGIVETLVVTSLEIIESLVKLNFSKAAKVLFDLGKQNVNLLDAEQKLTGKEIAYIQQTFMDPRLVK